MDETASRRGALRWIGAATGAGVAAALPIGTRAEEAGAVSLADLSRRLAAAPRRRDFKTVPAVLDDPDQWDHQALAELIAYRGGPKQVWSPTEIGGLWLTYMRNSLNVQVTSYRHPDLVIVAATHGTAQLALFDQAAWDTYGLADLTGGKFKANSLILPQPAQDQAGQPPPAPSSADNESIPALQSRGVVFLACHIAIWAIAGRIAKGSANADKLAQDAIAADLTNHLVAGVVLTPGAVGTLPELQSAGFLLAV